MVRHTSVARGTTDPQVAGPPSGLVGTVRRVPMKVSEIVRLLEQDGWTLKRTTGSHRHFTHPAKPGLVTVAGKPSATLKHKTEASILNQAGLPKGQP
jgi:predicted RNA binding protein YcfA (HicA-like mRNA interferase family)